MISCTIPLFCMRLRESFQRLNINRILLGEFLCCMKANEILLVKGEIVLGRRIPIALFPKADIEFARNFLQTRAFFYLKSYPFLGWIYLFGNSKYINFSLKVQNICKLILVKCYEISVMRYSYSQYSEIYYDLKIFHLFIKSIKCF